MTYEKFRTQLEIKSRNETTILKALREKPIRFKDLKENEHTFVFRAKSRFSL